MAGFRSRVGIYGKMEYTLFVNNLPRMVDRFDLGKLFMKFGDVTDVYSPKKFGRNSQTRFGFVRFKFERQRHEARRNLDGFLFKSFRLSVSWACYQKNHKRRTGGGPIHGQWQPAPKKGRHVPRRKWPASVPNRPSQERWRLATDNWVWRPKKSQTPVGISNASRPPMEPCSEKCIKEIHGSVCEENLEWLNKSIVCISNNLMDPDDMVTILKTQLPSLTRFTDMGKYKFVLSFESLEEAKRALVEKKYFLGNWFAEARLWEKTDVCHTRRTWIELFGLPPHGWKPENITEIAQIWGEVVCLNEETVEVKSLEAACVLVDTPHMRLIDDVVNFHLEDVTYKIKVLESRITLNTFSSSGSEDISEKNTISDPLVAHAEHSRTQANNVIEDNATVVAYSLVGDGHCFSSGSREPASSCTWSDVVRGRKSALIKKVGTRTMENGRHADEDSFNREARECYEVTAMAGLKAKEGYEEALIQEIEHDLHMERLENDAYKKQSGGY